MKMNPEEPNKKQSHPSTPEQTEFISQTTTEFYTYARWSMSSLMNALFLVLWISLQYGVNWVISQLQLSGIEAIVFTVFQVFFAISTITPVGFWVYKDFRIMWIRTHREIEKEKSSD